MILFRLLSFAIRLVMAFVFVTVLQISWRGKTLESYVSQWGQRIVGVPLLKKAGQRSAAALKAAPKPLSWPFPSGKKEKER